MTSKLVFGATMNSAPARMAIRAVSGSRTVPAPSNARSPNWLATASSTRCALGTVNVISTHSTPPATSASVTSASSSARSVRKNGDGAGAANPFEIGRFVAHRRPIESGSGPVRLV